jgi:two-component system, response regulator, stage 0 sporulation protein F
MATILVIDDQALIRTLLRVILEIEGHEVVEAANGRAGLALYRDRPTDLVITDIQMPEMHGLELIEELTRNFLNVKVIAMSIGQRDSPVFETARLLGARQILRKPFTVEEVLSIVRDELAH